MLNSEAPADEVPGGPKQPSMEALLQRQSLFEKLTRVQRSISHGAPLQEVLDAITSGASQLLGDEVVALRLIDDDDPTQCIIVSSEGVRDDLVQSLQRTPVGIGCGGRAIRENRLIVIQDYSRSPDSLEAMKQDGLQSAMAAPVHEQGEIAGSLVVASYKPGRTYSDSEQEVLVSFAEHASLALTDAKAIEALREAQRSKEMFLAMVSHELKSPLTVIIGTLHTLEKHHKVVDEATRAEMLSSAYARAKELASLVNQVLEGARAELAAAAEEVNLPDLVSSAVRGFELSLPLKISDIPEITIVTDTAAIRQVLGILLENAVAHSSEKQEVDIRAHLEETNVCISVSNNGILTDEDHETLFEPFSRGSGARSPGVGLGLYIAHRLAIAIGGNLTADSTEGRVRFDLRFPLKRADQQRLQSADVS